MKSRNRLISSTSLTDSAILQQSFVCLKGNNEASENTHRAQMIWPIWDWRKRDQDRTLNTKQEFKNKENVV